MRYAGVAALVLAGIVQAPARAQEAAPAVKAGSDVASATTEADSTQPAGPVVRAIAVRSEGDAVAIAITVTGGGRFALSEPFHSSDGVKLFVSILGARLAPALALTPIDGVRIASEQRADGVRIAVEVNGLGEYALEPMGEGAVLRIHAPNPAAEFASAFVAEPSAPVRERIASATSATGDRIATAAYAVRDVLASWRITPLQVGSIITVVLTPVLLLVIRRRRATSRPAATDQRASGDTRLWAARTLAKGGATAAEIAERTGLPRDAAALLLRRAAS